MMGNAASGCRRCVISLRSPGYNRQSASYCHVIRTAQGEVRRNRTVTSSLFVVTQRTAPHDAVGSDLN